MSHQCPFPVRASDTRRCYRTGSVPGFTLSLTLVAILSGYAGLADAAPAVQELPVPKGEVVGWAKGRLLAAPRAGLSDKEFEKALKVLNAKSKGRFQRTNTHVIELPPGLDEVKAMQTLKKDKRFKYVELDVALMPVATVNDPNFSSSWALPKIQAPTAWDTTNGAGVTIAILDTGVDSAHPDLATNIVPGWNIYDNNSNTSDVHGHGTQVAGSAAMVGNNSAGSAGVAWAAKIMPVRIAAPDGYANISTIAQGITYAADKGAKVANISYPVSGYSTIHSAADYMRSKGGVVVVGAGNTGGLVSGGANDSLLSISATGSSDVRASWSSYGDYVDLAAPGVSIYTTTRGGGYANASGTSIASPITAATAALMMAANSKLSPADIDKIFKSTSVDLGTSGFDQYYGYGRIEAAKAVATAKVYAGTGTTSTTSSTTGSTSGGTTTTSSADTQAPTGSITSPTGGSVSGIVAVDVSFTDNVGVARVELWVNNSKAISDDTTPFAFAWDTTALGGGTYTLVAKAYDAANNVGSSAPVSVTLGNDTTAPVISSFSLTEGMTVSNNQRISASATDNQRVAKVSLVIDGKEVATTTGSSISYNWNTRKVAKGSQTVTVRAWDAANNQASKTVTVYK